MKTLHVETGRHLYGGAQQVLYLLEGLARRGDDVVLVCPPESEIGGASRALGIPTHEISCGGDLDLRFVGRLQSAIREHRPDLVHCHSRRGADFLGGQAAARERLPAIVSRRVDNTDAKLMARLRYRHFRKIIAISGAIEHELHRSGVDPSRIEVVHDSVDVARFRRPPDRRALCREFGLAENDELIVSAAQLIPRKGQRYLLDAIAILADSRPRLRALLFGRGPEEHRLRQQAGRLGIDDRVSFAGFRGDLDDWLGAFDLLVHTALAEGLGVIALKAQAAGLPVIAFDAGGLPEVIEHEKTGILVEPRNVEVLSQQIASLLDDSRARERYARAARENVTRCFSIDAMVEAHLALYRDLLDEQ